MSRYYDSKISQATAKAFINLKPFSDSNTNVIIEKEITDDSQSILTSNDDPQWGNIKLPPNKKAILSLYDKENIAYYNGKTLYMCYTEHPKQVVQSRLNAILEILYPDLRIRVDEKDFYFIYSKHDTLITGIQLQVLFNRGKWTDIESVKKHFESLNNELLEKKKQKEAKEDLERKEKERLNKTLIPSMLDAIIEHAATILEESKEHEIFPETETLIVETILSQAELLKEGLK